MIANADPGTWEIWASRRRRRSDAGSVYVSFQRTPDDIMRTSRTDTLWYALPASNGTYRVTGSARLAICPCFTAAPMSVDVIDFAIDIDIQRVRSEFPNRYLSKLTRPSLSTRSPATRFSSR